MKIVKLTSIVLLLVLSIPIAVTVVTFFDNSGEKVMFCETQTEEQKEERETDREENINDLEDYILEGFLPFSRSSPDYFNSPSEKKSFLSSIREIVTPPPELG